jgi:hypothetical protein
MLILYLNVFFIFRESSSWTSFSSSDSEGLNTYDESREGIFFFKFLILFFLHFLANFKINF